MGAPGGNRTSDSRSRTPPGHVGGYWDRLTPNVAQDHGDTSRRGAAFLDGAVLRVCSDRADRTADRGGGLVGAVLLVIGVFGFVAAAVVSKRAFAPAQPGGAGSSDVPKWIPGVYIGSLVIA